MFQSILGLRLELGKLSSFLRGENFGAEQLRRNTLCRYPTTRLLLHSIAEHPHLHLLRQLSEAELESEGDLGEIGRHGKSKCR